VYKARCKQDGQFYCLKKIPPAADGASSYEAAMREAQLLSSLDHPNIIRESAPGLPGDADRAPAAAMQRAPPLPQQHGPTRRTAHTRPRQPRSQSMSRVPPRPC
jgi:hypothetical protein